MNEYQNRIAYRRKEAVIYKSYYFLMFLTVLFQVFYFLVNAGVIGNKRLLEIFENDIRIFKMFEGFTLASLGGTLL